MTCLLQEGVSHAHMLTLWPVSIGQLKQFELTLLAERLMVFSKDEEEDSKPGDSAGSDQDVDIFELEGQATELQLDPSKVEGVYSENGAYEFELAPDRIVGRSGFEGKASDNPASTSGRGQVTSPALHTSSHLDNSSATAWWLWKVCLTTLQCPKAMLILCSTCMSHCILKFCNNYMSQSLRWFCRLHCKRQA